MKKFSQLIRDGSKDTKPNYMWQNEEKNCCCAHGAAHLAATGEWDERDPELRAVLDGHVPWGLGGGYADLESWVNNRYLKLEIDGVEDPRLAIADALEEVGL